MISDDAGRFVCNYVYYHSLQFAEQKGHKSLFVHVPLFYRIDEETQMRFVASLLEAIGSTCWSIYCNCETKPIYKYIYKYLLLCLSWVKKLIALAFYLWSMHLCCKKRKKKKDFLLLQLSPPLSCYWTLDIWFDLWHDTRDFPCFYPFIKMGLTFKGVQLVSYDWVWATPSHGVIAIIHFSSRKI